MTEVLESIVEMCIRDSVRTAGAYFGNESHKGGGALTLCGEVNQRYGGYVMMSKTWSLCN